MVAEKRKNKPLILMSKTAFFDCCDTLVLYDFPQHYCGEVAIIEYEEHISGRMKRKRMAVNRPAVDRLIEHKKKGHCVVVWTRGSWQWAKGIVESLKLEEYVDVVMDKPDWLYDDLHPYHPDKPIGFLPRPELPLPYGWKQERLGYSVDYIAKCMKGKTCEKCGKGRYKHFRTELNNPHELYCTNCNYVIDKWRVTDEND